MDYLLEIIHVMNVIYVFDNVKRNEIIYINILFGKKFRIIENILDKNFSIYYNLS